MRCWGTEVTLASRVLDPSRVLAIALFGQSFWRGLAGLCRNTDRVPSGAATWALVTTISSTGPVSLQHITYYTLHRDMTSAWLEY